MVAKCCAGYSVTGGVHGLGFFAIGDQHGVGHPSNWFTAIVCTGIGCRWCGGGASACIERVGTARHVDDISAGSGYSHAITRSIGQDGLGHQ